LKKEYKYVPSPSAESDTADETGITESMLDFSWDRDVEMSVSSAATTIPTVCF
jgi:template-activating factor I